MSEVTKKKFTNIGTVMQAKKKNEDDANEAPRFYLKLEQSKDKEGKPYGEKLFPIKLANGVELNEGDILPMFDVRAKLKKKVADGKMTQAKANDLSFLRFEVCVAEEVNRSKGSGSDDINF